MAQILPNRKENASGTWRRILWRGHSWLRVPPVTVLGPILLLCHTNDLLNSVKPIVRLFADDCLLHTEINNENDHTTLQNDLKKHWEMGIRLGNAFQCQKVSSMKKKSHHSYILNNQILEQVLSNPYLGLQIAEDLKWKEHIHNFCKKKQFHTWIPQDRQLLIGTTWTKTLYPQRNSKVSSPRSRTIATKSLSPHHIIAQQGSYDVTLQTDKEHNGPTLEDIKVTIRSRTSKKDRQYTWLLAKWQNDTMTNDHLLNTTQNILKCST